jgi:hypothetical protein
MLRAAWRSTERARSKELSDHREGLLQLRQGPASAGALTRGLSG